MDNENKQKVASVNVLAHTNGSLEIIIGENYEDREPTVLLISNTKVARGLFESLIYAINSIEENRRLDKITEGSVSKNDDGDEVVNISKEVFAYRMKGKKEIN